MRQSIAKRSGKAVSGVCLIAEHETVIAEAIALLYILNVHHTPNISDEMDAFISGGLSALNTEVARSWSK